MKNLFSFILILAFAAPLAPGQVNDACKGDIIGKRAGSSPYTPPRDCDVVIMSVATFDSLGLLRKKLEKEIELLDQALGLAKTGMALRDTVIMEKDSIIQAQDVAIANYKRIAEEAIANGEASTANTDRCLSELDKQRKRTKLLAILSATGGFIAGVVVGVLFP